MNTYLEILISYAFYLSMYMVNMLLFLFCTVVKIKVTFFYLHLPKTEI